LPEGHVTDRYQREFVFDLAASPELIKLEGEDEWRALSREAHFYLKPKGGKFPAGWVGVKTRVRGADGAQPVKLYYDVGTGIREDAAVILPAAPDGLVDTFVKLPPGLRGLRWSPTGTPGHLIQGAVVMTRVRGLQRWKCLGREELIRLLTLQDFSRRLFLRHERLYKSVFQIKTRLEAGSYRSWVRRHRLTKADKRAIARHVERLARRPLISVLMPVYNGSAEDLRAAIASVQAQLYPHWELCIADDASTAPHVAGLIEHFRRSDPRIKVEYRKVNGHISAASNSALSLAQGEFIALLDQDDMLSADALYQVAFELNRRPDADIVYSDEDKIFGQDEASPSTRGDPHFKSDWNRDLLYSQNYISHLSVYRASLVKAVGGFREGREGSQDYDLLLRCLSARNDAVIRHIPAILYHWRASPGSTALDVSAKSYATDHGVKALEDHFRSRGLDGVLVEPGRFPTTYRVRFPLPEMPPKVSIIIASRNHHQVLRRCIESIRNKTTYSNYEIVVVDNQSDEPDSLHYFHELERSGVTVLRYDHPFNYSAINNFAVERANGEIVALLNNDIEVITPDWLTEMVSHALRQDVGAVGAKLYYPTDTIQHAGVIVGLGGVAGHSHKYLPRDNAGYFRRLWLTQNLSAVTGACLVVRRESYWKVGGLDATNLTIALNDVDFCLKLDDIGLRNVWTPYAELYHHESVSRGAEDSPEKLARFRRETLFLHQKWGERLRRDPYYSPMLTLEWETFTPDYRKAPRKPWLDQKES
jgi:GT2 family glycosyltransferase